MILIYTPLRSIIFMTLRTTTHYRRQRRSHDDISLPHPHPLRLRFFSSTSSPHTISPSQRLFLFPRECAKEFECMDDSCYQRIYIVYKYIYICIFLPLSSKSTVTLTVELRAMEQGTFEQPSMFR